LRSPASTFHRGSLLCTLWKRSRTHFCWALRARLNPSESCQPTCMTCAGPRVPTTRNSSAVRPGTMSLSKESNSRKSTATLPPSSGQSTRLSTPALVFQSEELPWIVTVPLPFIKGIYNAFVRYPDLPSSSFIPSIPLQLCHIKVTMSPSHRKHHTSDNTTSIPIPTHQNLHSVTHGGHVCEDRPQTHNILRILPHVSVDVRSYLLTVQNAPVFPIPNSHSPDRPSPSTRQVWRRLRAILQVLLASTLPPTRCIPVFTPSYIIPWSNTYPHPGHVSLGTASPLLLQSSRLSPVDLSSLLSSLDIYVRPLCSYFKVPTRSPSALLPHLDMMFQIFLKHHFHRRFGPLCGICFSFLQRILAHQNFASVRHWTRGPHLIMPSARLCLF